MGDGERVKQLDGAVSTFASAVETMVVGRIQYVESGIVDGEEKFVGSAETRVSRVGLSA